MSTPPDPRRPSITVGISGSSGAIYAVRLLGILSRFYDQVDVVMSTAARQVMQQETGLQPPATGAWQLPGATDEEGARVVVWNNQNYYVPFASGSSAPEQMVIIPCSMSTVASIANGVDQNVMHHAAAVMIKERRQLVVVPRETPFSTIHLRNLLTLAEAGVTVVPAIPGFYSGQATFDDLVDFVVQKVINQLRLPVKLMRTWGESGRGEG